MRLQQLLDEFRVKSASEITVGRLPFGGVGGSIEAAQLQAGRGRPVASAGGVRKLISASDAQLLVQHGAIEQQRPMSG